MTSPADRLRAVRERIAAAARAAGRHPAAVGLLAVSKTWPADDVRALAALGQTAFGANRAQELATKAAELADLPLEWHFVGQLQRNKAVAVARTGAVVHSLDRSSLARALSRAGEERGRPVDVFVQVDLGGAAGELAERGGAAPADVPALADEVADLPGLRLRGLMTIGARSDDEDAVRGGFRRLRELRDEVLASGAPGTAGATGLSMGMSGDLVPAVAEGATIVRIGSAVFGEREVPDRVATADPPGDGPPTDG